MPTSSTTTLPPTACWPAVAEAPSSSGDLFGLSLKTTMPLDGLAPLLERPQRQVKMHVRAGTAAWRRTRDAEVVYSAPARGRTLLAIDRRPQGYCVWGPRRGRFVISPDGTRIDAEVPAGRRWPWRLLLAQALPIAAALQGLEVLHAAAVAVDGRGIAIVASSGTGKTTLALELIRRGAGFVADDVLAIESTGHGIVAHPGVGVVNVDSSQLQLLPAGGRVVGRSVKHHVAVPRWPGPVPLERLYVLARGGPGKEPVIERLDPPDPRLLLGSTFVFVVGGAERLVRQLDIHRTLGAAVPVYAVRVPEDCGPGQLAGVVERHSMEPA